MSAPIIWYLIKFFTEERYAEQFMTGGLYLNTLEYFKKVETENSDGRIDSTEAVAAWLQPDDLKIKLNIPEIGDCEITKKDLAGQSVYRSIIIIIYTCFVCMPSIRPVLKP
jgi:hypothetical protein